MGMTPKARVVLPAAVCLAGMSLALVGGGQASTRDVSCVQPGVRYTGTTSEGGKLCLSITTDAKSLNEARFEWGVTACKGGAISVPATGVTTVSVTTSGTLSGSFSVPFTQQVSGQIIGGGVFAAGIFPASGTLASTFDPSGTASGTAVVMLRATISNPIGPPRTVTCTWGPVSWTGSIVPGTEVKPPKPKPVRGTAKADRLKGTPGNDTILGLAGNDVEWGLGGDDVLDGGAGSDKLIGGAGKDRYRCGPGKDTVIADAADVEPGRSCEVVKGRR